MLIDNCVPKRLASAIAGHNVACVVDLGWGALPDGTLLDRIANEHDALVTVDRNIRHQQRLDGRPIASSVSWCLGHGQIVLPTFFRSYPHYSMCSDGQSRARSTRLMHRSHSHDALA